MQLHKEYNGKSKGGHWFYNNTYMFNLYVFFAEYKDVEHIVGGERTSDACAVPMNEGDVALVFTKTGKGHDIIAHECLHGTNMVLSHKGVVPCFKNDEAQAYLLTWFIKCVYLAKKNNKKPKK